jgi:hypothetical protein
MGCGLPRRLSRGKAEANRKKRPALGNIPRTCEFLSQRAPGLAARPELHRNCAIIVLLNLAAPPSPNTFGAGRRRICWGLDLGIPAFVILVETLGDVLTFVVNFRLPIGWLKQSITSLSRAVGIRLAAAEWSSVDLS